MRKVLFFLFMFTSVNIWGQIAKEVHFDFTNPSSLGSSWKIPNKDRGETSVEITSSTASAGAITLSFKAGSAGIGAQCTEQDGSYFLRVTTSTRMTFAASNGASITEIRFSDDSYMGTLGLIDGQEGSLDIESMRKLWSCDGNYNIHSVTYGCSAKEAELRSVVIKYLDPVNVLDAVSTSLPSSGSLTSFNEMSLTFASAMTVEAADKIYIEDASGKKQSVTVVSKNNVVTVSVADALHDGDYKVVIPAGSLKDPEGYCNKDLQYSFTVNTPKNILIYEEVTPATGKVEILQSGIVMSFDKPVKVVNGEAMLYKDDEEWSLVNVERKADDSKAVVLTFDIPEGLADDGVYTIVIPEHAIENQVGKLYNPELVLEYTIGGTTPDEPDVPEDSDVMKAAKGLLENTGVGYPAANSAARTELDALTKATEVPTDEALTAAMDNFYKETVVELPEAGKYYKIATKNADADTLYLKYKDDKASFVLVDNKDDATAFEAEASEGMFSFKTVDGKYVAVNGVTTDVVCNQIKVEKFSFEGIDAVNLLGCVSLYGSIGKDVALGIEEYRYALMSYGSGEYGAAGQLYFTPDLSSAFMLLDADAPASDLTSVEVKYELLESVLTENNNVLVIKFPEIKDINIVDGVQAFISRNSDGSGQPINVTVVLDDTAEDGNIVKVSSPEMTKGKYYLVLPEGKILYDAENVIYTNKMTIIEFEWNLGGAVDPEPSPDFVTDYSGILVCPESTEAYEVDLNNFAIADAGENADNGFYVDVDKTVELRQIDTGRLFRTGKFVKSDEKLPGMPDYVGDIYKLVLNEPVKVGDIRINDTYTFVIPVATFGDNNFKAYLSGDKSVSASECHVNDIMKVTYRVSVSTGITNIENGDSEKVIYTITGRRVNEMSAPGIYIVNGKKIIKK